MSGRTSRGKCHAQSTLGSRNRLAWLGPRLYNHGGGRGGGVVPAGVPIVGCLAKPSRVRIRKASVGFQPRSVGVKRASVGAWSGLGRPKVGPRSGSANRGNSPHFQANEQSRHPNTENVRYPYPAKARHRTPTPSKTVAKQRRGRYSEAVNLRRGKPAVHSKTRLWEKMPEAVRCVRRKQCETLEKQGDEGVCVC